MEESRNTMDNIENAETAINQGPPAGEPERQQYFMERAKRQLAELSARLGRPLTCCINTFGCQMNARDSEKLLGILETIGYKAAESEKADFVLYNTCTVRENANLRVYGRLGQLGAYKKKHPDMMIALCGCMMQEEEVEKIDGIERIRFMTSHPKDLSDELIKVMAGSKKICRHLHLPLQSGSSRILKVMNRCYTKERYLDLAERIKKAVPGISLTTDIIVGFPGETDEDFEETMDVVRKVRFDSAFTFIYSKRTGTPAAAMEDQVPEEIVKERFDRLLKEVQDISAEVCGRDVKTVQEVLVEEVNVHTPGLMTGRLSNNTVVHFPGDPSMIGQLVPVYLRESRGFYYMGHMADKENG